MDESASHAGGAPAGPPAWSGHRLIFIGGVHRSGTTLLTRLMQSHPDVSGFEKTGAPEDEGQFLQDVFEPAQTYGGPGRFAFDERASLNETSALVSEGNRTRLWHSWSQHWDLSCPVLIEKSPPNIVRSRFLQAMFPSARFVFVVRHPLPVAFATRRWSHLPVSEYVRHWAVANDRMLADIPFLRHVLLLRYEDLVNEPMTTMREVQSLMGVELSNSTQGLDSSVNSAYFKIWSRYVIRRPLDAIRCLDSRDALQRFGYRLWPPYVHRGNLDNMDWRKTP